MAISCQCLYLVTLKLFPGLFFLAVAVHRNLSFFCPCSSWSFHAPAVFFFFLPYVIGGKLRKSVFVIPVPCCGCCLAAYKLELSGGRDQLFGDTTTGDLLNP